MEDVDLLRKLLPLCGRQLLDHAFNIHQRVLHADSSTSLTDLTLPLSSLLLRAHSFLLLLVRFCGRRGDVARILARGLLRDGLCLLGRFVIVVLSILFLLIRDLPVLG
jgi:hypothetical protein